VRKPLVHDEREGQAVVHAHVTLAVKGGRKTSTFSFGANEQRQETNSYDDGQIQQIGRI